MSAVRGLHVAVQVVLAFPAGSVASRHGGTFLSFVDFGAVDGDVPGGFDPEAHLVSDYAEHGDGDFLADVDRLDRSSRENEHSAFPPTSLQMAGAVAACTRAEVFPGVGRRGDRRLA